MASAAETVSHETPPEDLRSNPDHPMIGYSSTMGPCSQQRDSTTLMTIPTEIRLDIYKHAFATSTKITLRRRDEIDDEELLEKLPTSLIPNLLATCHQIHREALPTFYGSRVFYFAVPYLMFTGSEAHKQSSVYGSRLLYPRNHLGLIAHLSLGWGTSDLCPSDNDHVDQIVAAGIGFFMEECSQLRTLTLNFLPRKYSLVACLHFQGGDATAMALHTLRHRLDELIIIVLGLHVGLYGLRESIAEDERLWEYEKYESGPWPGMTLKRAHQNILVELQRRSRPIKKYTLPWKTCRPGIVGKVVEGSLASSTNSELDEDT